MKDWQQPYSFCISPAWCSGRRVLLSQRPRGSCCSFVLWSWSLGLKPTTWMVFSCSGEIWSVLKHLLEKEMAPHSITLAWRIPWRKETGRLQSMGSQRVGHDWATSLTQSISIQVALVVKNLPAVAGDIGDAGLIPGSGRSQREGNGNHSSIRAWRIPWTEEPDGLQSWRSWRVRHDWNNLAHTKHLHPML